MKYFYDILHNRDENTHYSQWCYRDQLRQSFLRTYLKQCIGPLSSLVGFLSVLVLILVGAAAEHLSQRVPDTAHEECAEEVLERYERVVNTQQDG